MIRPAVLDVANLMPDRTTVIGGSTVGTFTTETHPTAVQVDGIIDMVLDTVDPKVPLGATPEAERSARAIVTLTAAILTEATYFSHQGDVSEVRIGVWQRLIEQHELTLQTAAAAAVAAEEGIPTLVAGAVTRSTTDIFTQEITITDVLP